MRTCGHTAAPVFMNLEETGAHEWCIEQQPPAGGMALFMSAWMPTASSEFDYDAKRTAELALRSPSGMRWQPGRSTGGRQRKLGGQHKVPRLANDRAIVDALLAGRVGGERANCLTIRR